MWRLPNNYLLFDEVDFFCGKSCIEGYVKAGAKNDIERNINDRSASGVADSAASTARSHGWRILAADGRDDFA
jgi:hypothetical protein